MLRFKFRLIALALAVLTSLAAVGCGAGVDPSQGDPSQGDPSRGDPSRSDPSQGNLTQGDPVPSDPTEGMLSSTEKADSPTDEDKGTAISQTTVEPLPTLDTGFSKFDLNAAETADGQTTVVLNDAKTQITGTGAVYESDVLTISAAGTYVLSGTLNDGRIVVSAGENDKVRLVLSGVDITCTTDAPMLFTSADKVAIILAKGTQNEVTDARTAVSDEEADGVASKAAITSHVSLTLNGEGSLTVNGGCRNGITTKKNLRIVSGTLTVEANNVGLKGNNSVSICGGDITIDSVGDCIKTEEIDNTAKGFVDITGGTLTLTTEGDGISASQYFLMSGGTLNVTTTGTVTASSSNSEFFGGGKGNFGGFGGFGGWWGDTDEEIEDSVTASSKGIKADTTLRISGGKITVNSTGHCIHSAGSALVEGNVLITLHSESGKGMAAHGDLQIDGGTIDVTYSYEGLESKRTITINGGNITIYATDDGMNTGGTNEADCRMTFNGGSVSVNAAGDGIDSNGDIHFNGGTVVIAGPENSGNGPLDCGDRSSIYVNGGTVVAYGAIFQSNADNPATSSEQCCLRVGLSARAGTVVTLSDSTGKVLYEIMLEKSATNMYISLPTLTVGETYTVSTDDSTVATLTMNSVFTSNLSGAGGMGGMQPGGGMGPGGMGPGGMGGGMRPGGRW